MRAHYLQHVPFEGLGYIESWLESHEFTITSTCFYDNDKLPNSADIDMLIIMGGPMSVNDSVKFPWLEIEKRFIRDVIALEKPVIGICLGAQLIANCLGSPVYQNSKKEIGWFPVEFFADDHKILNGLLPERITVFHWHGETFDLPEGALHLAKTDACTNQAFLYNKNVIGLQFHLETTLESLNLIVRNCKDELAQPDEFIMSESRILSTDQHLFEQNNLLMDSLLNFITGRI